MTGSPVLYIQCDWDDFIRKLKGKVWVSLRKRGESSPIHGKIENAGTDSSDRPKFLTTDGFSAEILAQDLCKVEHKETSTSILFLAPTKIYTEIHKKSVPCLSVTSTGLCASFGIVENNLQVWDCNRGELKLKLEGHVGDVYRCKFFPSEKVVLTGGADMQLKIWCAETGKNPVTLKGHHRAVTDFVIVDVGRNVISVSKDGTAKLWDCGESKCLDTLISVSSDINCCAICPVSTILGTEEPHVPASVREIGTQNKVLLVGCEDGTVHGIAVCSRKKLFTLVLDSPVNSVAFLKVNNESAEENRFFVGCQNGSVRIYSLNSPRDPIKVIWDLNSPVLCVTAYQDAGVFVSHAEGSVYFIRNVSYDRVVSLTGSDCDPIYDVATDGRFIYTSCRDGVIRRYVVERALRYLS